MLNQSIKRFSILHTKLLKKQYEQMFKAQASSKEDLKAKIKEMQRGEEPGISMKEQIALVSGLAKTEILSVVDQDGSQSANTLKTDLLLKIQEINARNTEQPTSQMSPQDIYAVSLLMHLSRTTPSENENLFNLYKILHENLQTYIRKRLSSRELKPEMEEQTMEIQNNTQDGMQSIQNDKIITQFRELIQLVVKYILKLANPWDITTALLQDLGLFLGQIQSIDQNKDGVIKSEQMAPFAVVLQIVSQMLGSKHFANAISPQLQANQGGQQGAQILNLITLIFEHSQILLNACKLISRYHLLDFAANWKKQGSGNKEVKRSQGLFTEIQNILIQFNCTYFKKFFQIIDAKAITRQCESTFQIIFIDEDAEQEVESDQHTSQGRFKENFILSERLQIMNELNDIFNMVPSIIQNANYWSFVRRGLSDLDALCRKLALSILQANIQKFQTRDDFKRDLARIHQEFQMDQKEFENLWATFFDIYDTLDSFSSHLTKAIWERTELFYAFLSKHHLNWHSNGALVSQYPLIDFQGWLHVLNSRALNHENQNVRKYIQKEILQRKYVTSTMADFIFGQLLGKLNGGLILRDSNAYTQFSKNNELVMGFYGDFLMNESLNLEQDMRKLFYGLREHIDHPQMMVSILKVLGKNFNKEGVQPARFIGLEELRHTLAILESFKNELIFSNRYLCYKFILAMITTYLRVEEFQSGEFQSVFLKIVGLMPFELFSASEPIIYTDREGLECAAHLIEQIGKESVQNMLKAYLNDIFQVKASMQAMPKFQGPSMEHVMKVVRGIVKILLILDTKYEDVNAIWFQEAMQQNLEIFYGQVLTSSYISSEVIDQKIMCFTHIYNDLIKYSATQKHRDLLIYQVKLGANLILERIENSLLVPLSLYAQQEGADSQILMHGFQDKSKMASAFAQLQTFCGYISIAIKSFHIYVSQTNFGQQSTSDSVMEKIIKLVLSHALKSTQLEMHSTTQKLQNIHNSSENGKTTNLGVLMWQHVVFELLFSILKAYSEGIHESIKRNKDNLMVPDDIFTIGKSVCMNLMEFAPVVYDHQASAQAQASSKREDADYLEQILIDNGITAKKIMNRIGFNNWAIMGEFLKLFGFDANLKDEMQMLMYPKISEKTLEYQNENMHSGTANSQGGCRAKGTNWTQEEGLYTQVIFSLLKQTYLPLMIHQISTNQNQPEIQMKAFKEYQEVCWKCWATVKSLKGIFELQALQEFLELAFSDQFLEMQFCFLGQYGAQADLVSQIADFHKALAQEIFEIGNQFWLILRSTFNHLLFIFAKKPYLLVTGFHDFLINFSTCREIRSLDSVIHLYRFETLLPEVIPKKYENLSMEEISYQGAYVRCMCLIVIEGIIHNVLTSINCLAAQDAFQDHHIQTTLGCLETSILRLLENNATVQQFSQSEMPYSQQHREKLRIWQSLVVFLQLLDPQIYTQEFRQNRAARSGFDVIEKINVELFSAIKANHCPSVRQYIEIFTVKFCFMFPEATIGSKEFLETLLDPNAKPQVSSSYILVAGYCMQHAQTPDDSQTTHLKKQIFEALIGFCSSNAAHSRCMAQYFVREMFDDPTFRAFIPQGLESLYNYFEKSKDAKRLINKYREQIRKFGVLADGNGVEAILSTQIDSYGEFIHKPFIENIKTITQEEMTQQRNTDNLLGNHEQYWLKELGFRQQRGELNIQMDNLSLSQNQENGESAAVQEQIQNYQRKVLPWEQMELEKDKLKRLFENRKRNEVIICASLIDKVPNLAGLTRTCEIMNAQALIVSNKDVVKSQEFQSIAVTAQKWLPIYEVWLMHLLQYLTYQKSNGYTILGLEQTANSKMLNEYKFPEKCILLLGKEKEGIPQEYLGILDECIEIPQFGVIRSLNVHVSGALCLWEYTKQQYRLTEK